MADNLDKDLEDAMRLDTLMRPDQTKPRLVTPTNIAKIIEDATNPDTGRTSKAMLDQMTKIIAGLEKEINESSGVLDTIHRHIVDLQTTLGTAKAAVRFLQLGK